MIPPSFLYPWLARETSDADATQESRARTRAPWPGGGRTMAFLAALLVVGAVFGA